MSACSFVSSQLFFQDPVGLREHTYELAYNAACYLIGRGEYTQALDKLKKAEGKFPENKIRQPFGAGVPELMFLVLAFVQLPGSQDAKLTVGLVSLIQVASF